MSVAPTAPSHYSRASLSLLLHSLVETRKRSLGLARYEYGDAQAFWIGIYASSSLQQCSDAIPAAIEFRAEARVNHESQDAAAEAHLKGLSLVAVRT